MTVRAYMKKWSPVTKGIREDAKGLCAWALEREVRYLHDILDESGSPIGSALKYLFPTVRRAIDQWRSRSPLVRLAECVDRDPESDEDLIRTICGHAWHYVVNDVDKVVGQDLEHVSQKFLSNLADRLVESIHTYPGIDG